MTEPFAARRARALEAVGGQGAEVFLASDIGTIRWLTGLAQDIEWGTVPWSSGIHLLLTSREAVLIVPEGEGDTTASDRRYEYESFTTAVNLLPHRHAAEALRQALDGTGIDMPTQIAVEGAAVPGALLMALAGRPVIDAGPSIRATRAVKDDTELAAIRAAAQLVSRGHRALRECLRPGLTEIELWSAVHAAIEREAGTRVPALCDLISGERCAEVGGPPTDRMMAENELVIFDLVPRRDGYWADSCVTYCAGTPPAGVRRLHDVAQRALDAGVRSARPGVAAGQLDNTVRAFMRDAGYEYPHHTGHGIGLSVHEEPRIVPGSDMLLQENMVLALEPGSYFGGLGLRVEHLVLVRPEGGEVLTDYSLDLV